MAKEEIRQYIAAATVRGLGRPEIEASLRSAGWTPDDIAAAFVEQEVLSLRREFDSLNARLSRLEGKPALAGQPLPGPVQARVSPARPIVNVSQAGREESVESKVTGKWFAVVGIVALLFGVAFFLKYAFDNNLIGVTGRVIMGLVAGLAFVFLGNFLSQKEKYRQYSFFITGGGLALLYLTIYAAFSFYHLVSQPIALAFMIVVTALGMTISLLEKSESLAALALVGGFLTPFLLSTGVDNQFGLFTYVLILNVGFLIASFFQRWNRVYLVNFIGTYLVFGLWFGRFYDKSKLFPTLFFLTVFFAIFLLAPFLRSLWRRAISSPTDFVLTAINAAVYFGLSYWLLKPDYEPFLGFLFAFGALIHVLLAQLISYSHREDRYGVLALGGLGLVLLTAAIPIQLTGRGITFAWLAEAVMLLGAGFWLKNYYLRAFSVAVFVLATLRLLITETYERTTTQWQPIINDRFFIYLVFCLVMFVVAYWYARRRADLTEQEKALPAAFGLGANLLLVFTVSLEVSVWAQEKWRLLREASQTPTVFRPALRESDAWRSVQNTRNLLLSVLWAVHAAVLMVVGIIRRLRYARLLALGGFAVVVLKVFLYDIGQLKDLYRIISFISLGVILLVVSFLFYRYKEEIKKFLLGNN